MAMLFGIHLLSTLIVGLFIAKILSKYSYALIIFYNLEFTIPPFTAALGEFSSAYKEHNKKRKGKGEPLAEFTIPRDSEIELRTGRVTSHLQICKLPNLEDIDMTVLLSMATVAIYGVTECSVALGLSRSSDLHLSYIWSAVLGFFCLRFLTYMVGVYLSVGPAERNLCVLSAFLSAALALFTGMASREWVDFGLDKGYGEFVGEFTRHAANSSLEAVSLPSVKAFKGILILLSALLGVLLTFPSFRFGALSSALLDKTQEKGTLGGRMELLLVHFNLLAPLLLSLLWVRPLAEEHITAQTGLTEEQFSLLRVVAVGAVLLIRLASLRLYLSCHLHTAQEYMTGLKREAGRIDHSLVQKKIAYIFQYSSVVVLQILAPCVLMLQFCLVLLSLRNSVGEEPVSGFRGVLTTSFLTGLSSYFLWWSLALSTVMKLCGTLYFQVSGQA